MSRELPSLGADPVTEHSRLLPPASSLGVVGGQRFPKAHRVRKRWEYLRVQQCAKKLHSSHLLVLCAPSEADAPRLGITVSKKVSKLAVERNRIKRALREAFRQNRSAFPAADIVAVAKRGAHNLAAQALASELLELAARAPRGDTAGGGVTGHRGGGRSL